MWGNVTRNRWLRLLLFISVFCIAACSTQHQDQHEELALSDDPFTDPFFTESPEWDASVLQQSEVLKEEPMEPERPKTFAEKSEGFIFSTLIVGASLAKLALPFVGF